MHAFAHAESRGGPIGAFERSGRRLRNDQLAAVLGWCKNLRFRAPRRWPAGERPPDERKLVLETKVSETRYY